MKHIILIFVLGMLTGSVSAQNRTISPNAPLVDQQKIPAESLKFKESEYNFGKIPQGKPVSTTFTFINTGKSPLILNNVHASCGCTTPIWKKDTIPSGGSSKIVVGYNAAAEGQFAKPITITYNGNLTKQIVITGEVWKTPVTSAPDNEALLEISNLNNPKK